MSSPHSPDSTHLGSTHLDRGELADEMAGVAAPAVAEHLVGCPDCSARLAALSTASASVTQYLRTDPDPELPPAVAARFAAAIATESAARPSRAASAAATPATPRVPSRPRHGWWARHTRLGGVLVTAAAVVVVGVGGTFVANWVGGDTPTNQATDAGRMSAREDSGAPGGEVDSKATPLGAVAGAVALHRATMGSEVAGVLSAGSRTTGELTSAQKACATDSLADTDLGSAALSAVSGAFTLDGTRVLVLVAEQDGTRTAVAISGCSSGEPQVAARGDLP